MLHAAVLRRQGAALVLALLLLAAPAGLAAAATVVHTLGPWGYSRRITSPGQAPFIRLAIPEGVASLSRADLNDLRIADERGVEVAHIKVPGAGGRPDLVFFRSPERQYHLLYGNPAATAPAYGVEFPTTAATEPGSLGQQEANPFYASSPELKNLTWPRRYPFAFYSIAGTILILLFGGIYARTVGRMRRERRKIALLLAQERAESGNKPED